MYCEKCGKELPNDALFCDSCGQKTKNSPANKSNCAYCGAALTSNDVFCPVCGAPVEGGGKSSANQGNVPASRTGGANQGSASASRMGGANQGNAPANRTGSPNYNGGTPNYGNGQSGGKSNTLLIVLIIIIAVILVAVCALVGYSVYKMHSETETTLVVNDAEETEIPAEETLEPISTEIPATEVPVQTQEVVTVTPATQTVIVPVPAPEQPAAPANPAPVNPAPAAPAQSAYLFNSDSEIITYSYLNTQTQKQVRLILNEMYARHGYIFSSQEYSNYFNSKSWYTPLYTSAEQVEGYFNSVERKNKEIIVAYEKEKGYR